MRERDQRRKYKQYLRLKKVLESIRKDKEKCAEREETLNVVLESLKARAAKFHASVAAMQEKWEQRYRIELSKGEILLSRVALEV